MARTVTIASVYPLEMSIRRPLFTPKSVFKTPAHKKGGAPTLLVIENQFQSEKVPLQNRNVLQTIPAMDIANDFIRETTTNAPHISDGIRPGIWICAGDAPTEEEIAENLKIQEAFFQRLVQAADDLAHQQKLGAITDLMRAAADWLNYQADWRYKPTAQDNKQCQYCTKVIPGAAIICPHCQQIVDFEKYAAMEARKAEALKKVMPHVPVAPNVPLKNQPRA